MDSIGHFSRTPLLERSPAGSHPATPRAASGSDFTALEVEDDHVSHGTEPSTFAQSVASMARKAYAALPSRETLRAALPARSTLMKAGGLGALLLLGGRQAAVTNSRLGALEHHVFPPARPRSLAEHCADLAGDDFDQISRYSGMHSNWMEAGGDCSKVGREFGGRMAKIYAEIEQDVHDSTELDCESVGQAARSIPQFDPIAAEENHRKDFERVNGRPMNATERADDHALRAEYAALGLRNRHRELKTIEHTLSQPNVTTAAVRAKLASEQKKNDAGLEHFDLQKPDSDCPEQPAFGFMGYLG